MIWQDYTNVVSLYHFLLQYTVREAAKSVGLWDTAPQLEEISPECMAEFYEAVCHHHALILYNLMLGFTWLKTEMVGVKQDNIHCMLCCLTPTISVLSVHESAWPFAVFDITQECTSLVSGASCSHFYLPFVFTIIYTSWRVARKGEGMSIMWVDAYGAKKNRKKISPTIRTIHRSLAARLIKIVDRFTLSTSLIDRFLPLTDFCNWSIFVID